ncbi:MAG: PQQ-binding-like beta-propeller repeat protein [Bacteroidales bacterium]|nr:PQQ-binding-like beta-propeller repeat protein [Candidatus Scybalocola fimicaballi]
MRGIFTATVLALAALAHAQTVAWEAPVNGKAERIFFNGFTQTPIVEMSDNFVGVDAEKSATAWTVQKAKGNENLKKAAKVAALTGNSNEASMMNKFEKEVYQEVEWTQFVFVGDKVIDVVTGETIIDGVREIQASDIIPELNIALVRIDGTDKNVSLHAIDIESNKVLWKMPLPKPKKAIAANLLLDKKMAQCRPGISADGNVIYGFDQFLYLLDAKTGNKKWENLSKPELYLIDNSNKYIFSIESGMKKVHLVDAKTGKDVWAQPMKLSAPFADLIQIDNTQAIIASDVDVNIIDIKAGNKKWKKSFAAPFFKNAELTKEGVRISYGNKIQMVNKSTGEKVWKKPIELEDVDEAKSPQVEKQYNNTFIILTNNRLVVYDKETNKRKFKLNLDPTDRVAFDHATNKIVALSGKKVYVIDPDGDAKLPAVVTKVDDASTISGLKVSDNGYFIYGAKEYVMIDKNKNVTAQKVYPQLKTGRGANAALLAASIYNGIKSTKVTVTDANGNVVAEGGVFCSAAEADQAARASKAQSDLRHKLKDNEKAKKAVKASEDLSVFLTSEKVNGEELVQLAVVDQNTGKEVKTFRLSDDKNVVYEIDFNSNTVYAVDGGKLKAIKY